MNDSLKQSIWSLCIEGDINAFSTLFKKYYSQLHNYYRLKISKIITCTKDCFLEFFAYLSTIEKTTENRIVKKDNRLILTLN